MVTIQFTRVEPVTCHPYLRAFVDLTLSGLALRGLRLEVNSRGDFSLGYPGRKVQGRWQTVFEPVDPKTRDLLLMETLARYQEVQAAA